MSAVCGVVGLDGRPWREPDLDGMMRELAPHGPNGSGSWAGTAGRCGVALAGALRHATPEDAFEQVPATSADGALILVADLRLENRDELAAALGLRNDVSVPDSALVLAAYERWGDGLPARILGEFAFALADRRRGGVLLARDHAGSRPLVVHERPGVLAFASTTLALTAFEGVGHALDVRRAAELLAYAYLSERTFVAGVRWVPPAAALWVTDSGVRRWTWWDPDPHEVVDLPAAEHERALREALDVAVAARLRSTGRVGAMVSGGLDSASSAATAARQLAPDALPTYTSAPPPGWSGTLYPPGEPDDTPLVEKLVELHPNMAPTFVHVARDESLFALHEPLWELGATPGTNPCNWLWFDAIFRRARADGVTTLLSGGNGNCGFSADASQWLGSLLRARRFGTATRELAAWSRATGQSRSRTVRTSILPQLVPQWSRRVRRIARRGPHPAREWARRGALRPELVDGLRLHELRPMLDERRRPDEREFLLWLVFSGAALAESRTALAALTGVEERDPTVDRRLLEVAIRQPDWVRRRDGIARAVARGAMADRLPPEIARRRTFGEQLPDWLDILTASRREVADELEQLAAHETSRALIDVGRLRRLVDSWPDRSARGEPTVVRDYRRALFRGLVLSRYLRWFERRAASRRA